MKVKILTILLTFVTLEVVSRLAYSHYFNQNGFTESLQFPKKNKYFCDGYHKNVAGQELAAKCWLDNSKDISTLNKKVWILGGSTATDDECGSKNETWMQKIFADGYGKSVKNYSEDSMTTDIQINTILKLLKSDTPDIIVFSMFGSPELHFYGDERDRNYKKLFGKKIIKKNPNQNNIIRTAMFLIRISKTIEKYYYTYKFFLSTTLKIHGKLTDFLNYISAEDKMGYKLTPWDKAIASQSTLAPVRYMVSTDSLNYAIENYRINLEDIYKISREKNIEIVCALHPYFKNYFQPIYPYMVTDYIKWMDTFYNEALALCQKYKFKTIDVNKCFNDAILRP